MKPFWIRAAEFAGLRPEPDQIEQMGRFADWLGSEAVRAGGIGPGEVARIDRRHLADSMLFATQLPRPALIWDLGSGVGLPGIPLAICLPDCDFALIDRSRRRTDLMRRIVRILGLDNCEVIRKEIESVAGHPDAIVSRASLPPQLLLEIARTRLDPGGVAVAAGSWQQRPRYEGWFTVEIPRDVLDHDVWLLMMRRE